MIKEISPLEISGMMGSFSQLSLTVGVFFGQFLSYVMMKWTGDESGE
jgi:putative Mn2+ efflux pump MntP